MSLRTYNPSGAIKQESLIVALRKALVRTPRPGTLLDVVAKPAPELPAADKSLSKLQAISARLQNITTQIEPEFEELRVALTELHEYATGLSSIGRARAEAIGATLRSNRFSGDGGLVTASLQELHQALDDSASHFETLSSMKEPLSQLEQQGAAIDRVALTLQSTVCSFAVESSRTAEGRESFSDFVAGLRDLSARMRSMGEEIVERSAATAMEQVSATEEVAAGLAELRHLSGQSANAISNASQRVQEMLDRSHESLARIEEHAGRISDEARTALEAIHFGDTVGQKLDPIFQTLNASPAHIVNAGSVETASDASAETAPEQTAPTVASRPEADQSFAIQVTQLEELRAQAQATREQLSTAFTRLELESNKLVEEFGALSGNLDGAVALRELQVDLQKLQSLQQRGENLNAKSIAGTQSLARLSSDLAKGIDEVTELNRELHLQALNAIVKTAWLGEIGATLAVLSTHVHDVSRESSGSVEQILTVLQRIQDVTTSLQSPEGVATTSAIKALDSGLGALAHLPKAFQEAFQEASTAADEQRTVIDLAVSRASCLTKLEEHAASVMDDLVNFQRELASQGSAASIPAASKDQLSGPVPHSTDAIAPDLQDRPATVAGDTDTSNVPPTESAVETRCNPVAEPCAAAAAVGDSVRPPEPQR